MIGNEKSRELMSEAQKYIPGGINTAIRATDRALVFRSARGARIYDVDGNEYIDYHGAFGPAILGHCNANVTKRVFETIKKLDLIGAGTTELEVLVARKIVEHVPSAELVHFCNSGSEATYHAVRLSRAVTGRKKIIKFQGCYHGWHDYLCMNVITPPDRIGMHDPASAGMLQETYENTIIQDFNDLEGVENTIQKEGEDIAAIILEPIPHNVGCIMPKQEFLEGLRKICTDNGIILVFDEVITGFRHDLGGYQRICGVTPDLTTLGKAIANGYPCAAICGKKELMTRFATAGGDVYFSGTYNAHPTSMAAALATIKELEEGRVHRHIFHLGENLRSGIKDIIEDMRVKAHVAGFGSIFVVYFLDSPVENYKDLLRSNKETDLAFRWALIDRGVFILPMALKRAHISAAHTKRDAEESLSVVGAALREVSKMKPP